MWRLCGKEVDEIQLSKLGWDITDFGSGNFLSCGLTLFTLRNGGDDKTGYFKPYAEKIMLVREQQVTPLHCHHTKTEDIINRGGLTTNGDLVVQLYHSTAGGKLADTSVHVICDGILRKIDAGKTVTLKAGESITLLPHTYHTFYATNGPALIGEISSTNNDADDNYFHLPIPRFPVIEEDEPPLRLLCTEYLKRTC